MKKFKISISDLKKLSNIMDRTWYSTGTFNGIDTDLIEYKTNLVFDMMGIYGTQHDQKSSEYFRKELNKVKMKLMRPNLKAESQAKFEEKIKNLEKKYHEQLNYEKKFSYSSDDFVTILQGFEGLSKKVFLTWVLSLHSLIKDKEIHYSIFYFPEDEKISNEITAAAEEGLVELNLNIDGWTEKDFDNLAEKIEKIPVFRVSYQGIPDPTINNLLPQLMKLYNVQFFECKDEKQNIAKKATYLSYLSRQLLIKKEHKLNFQDKMKLLAKKQLEQTFEYVPREYPYSYITGSEVESLNSYVWVNHLSALYTGRKSEVTNATVAQEEKTLIKQCKKTCLKNIPEFFEAIIQELIHREISNFNINLTLTEEYLNILIKYAQKLPFHRINLKIKPDLIQTSLFQNFLLTLKNNPKIKELYLYSDEFKCPETYILPYIKDNQDNSKDAYLVMLTNINHEPLPIRKTFEEIEIKRLQTYNFNELKKGPVNTSTTTPPLQSKKLPTKDFIFDNVDDPHGEPNRLKKQITDNLLKGQKVNVPLQVDIIAEEAQTQNEVHQQSLQTGIELKNEIAEIKQQDLEKLEDLQQRDVYQSYSGELFDYNKFTTDIRFEKLRMNIPAKEREILFITLKNEYFGNLPHAIKKITLSAAIALYQDLSVHVAKNPKNPGENFVLRECNGEIVLHHDMFYKEQKDINEEHKDDKEEKNNVFSPKILSSSQQQDPIFTLSNDTNAMLNNWNNWYNFIVKDELDNFINDLSKEDKNLGEVYKKSNNLVSLTLSHKESFAIAIFGKDATKPFPFLQNLYITVGMDGIKYFISRLALHCNNDFRDFLVINYLKHFKHWDHFCNHDFFQCLEEINNYSPTQLKVFKKFLEKAGPSQHNLRDSVNAFNDFWKKVSEKVKDHAESLDILAEKKWTTVNACAPCVSMERLWTIINNAADPVQQINYLDKIELNFNGPYYASQYEGFKLVSSGMKFKPSSEEIKSTLHQYFYRIKLEDLITKSNPNLSEAEKKENKTINFTVMATRFLAQKAPVLDIIKFKDFTSSWNDTAKCTALLLIKDQNYNETQLAQFLLAIQPLKEIPPAESYFINRCLLALSQQRIIFTAEEASLISHSIAKLCTLKEPLDKTPSIEALFAQLTYNKYATFRLLSLFNKEEKFKDQSIADTLQIFHFFNSEQNFPISFKEDLLLFSGKIKEHHDSKEVTQKNVKDFILKTLTNQTFRSTFQKLLRADAPFTWEQCDNIFNEVSKLKFKNPDNEIDGIIKKFNITVGPLFISSFTREKSDVKPQLINMILGIKKIVKDQKEETLPIFITLPVEQFSHDLFKALLNDADLESFIKFIRNNITRFISTVRFTELHTLQSKATSPENLRKSIDAILKKINEKNPTLMLDMQRAYYESHAQTDEIKESTKLLDTMNVEQLEMVLQQEYSQSKNDPKLEADINEFLQKQYDSYKNTAIAFAFVTLPKTKLMQFLQAHLQNSAGLVINNIEEMKVFRGRIQELTKEIKNFSDENYDYSDLFARLNFEDFSYAKTLSLLTLFSTLHQKNKTAIFENISTDIKNENTFLSYIGYINDLIAAELPSNFIIHAVALLGKMELNLSDYRSFIDLIRNVYAKNSNDELLNFALGNSNLNFQMVQQILTIANIITSPTEKREITNLFNAMPNIDKFITSLSKKEDAAQIKIASIIAKSYQISVAALDPDIKSTVTAKIHNLLGQLIELNDEDLTTLYQASTVFSVDCLTQGFETYFSQPQEEKKKESLSFSKFITKLEKAPFGPRDGKEFSWKTEEIERIINQSKDMLNVPDGKEATKFLASYRQQLIEGVDLVYSYGNRIPLYNDKSAKDLSNTEIQAAFKYLRDKKGKLEFLDKYAAIALIRETMYRTNKIHLNEMQVTALINTLGRQKHLSNIDTGQGKSLVDVSKAVLALLLGYDSADITTSQENYAARDLDECHNFLTRLDIPHSENPITSKSKFAEYKTNGINFSTSSDLSIFMSRAEVETQADNDAARICKKRKKAIILSESDQDIFYNAVVNRFAIQQSKIDFGYEWIYDAVNEFIDLPDFMDLKNSKTERSEAADILAMKRWLRQKAEEKGINPKLFDLKSNDNNHSGFEDDDYIAWMEAALTAKYIDRSKYHITPNEIIEKFINGKLQNTRVVRVIGNENTICEADRTFGKGVHQFLCARLNAKLQQERKSEEKELKENKAQPIDYVLEPESKTIIATIFEDLLLDYDFVGGSSGTVGDKNQVRDQYTLYQLEASKIEPQDKSKRVEEDPILCEEIDTQFAKIAEKINGTDVKPILVFCKDIKTTDDLKKDLSEGKKIHTYEIQSYVGEKGEAGISDIKTITKKAEQKNQVTVTTAVLGRSTNIRPTVKDSLVIDTFIDLEGPQLQRFGRTARKDDKGTVIMILNRQDIDAILGRSTKKPNHKETKDEINALIKEVRAKQAENLNKSRILQRELFALLREFRADIKKNKHKLPNVKDFYLKIWADFSNRLEKEYYKLDPKDSNENFKKEKRAEFNLLLTNAIKILDEKDLNELLTKFEDQIVNIQAAAFWKSFKEDLSIEYYKSHFSGIYVSKDFAKQAEEAFLKEVQTSGIILKPPVNEEVKREELAREIKEEQNHLIGINLGDATNARELKANDFAPSGIRRERRISSGITPTIAPEAKTLSTTSASTTITTAPASTITTAPASTITTAPASTITSPVKPYSTYKPHSSDVKTTELLPPELTELYAVKAEDKENKEDKEIAETIQKLLQNIFENIKKPSALKNAQQEYISYFKQHKTKLKTIRKAHENFIFDFFNTRIGTHSFRSKFSRTMGELSAITNDANYIYMFNLLTHVNGKSIASIQTLKLAILTLLVEYLQNPLVNSTRSDEVNTLIKKISNEISTPEELISALNQSKITMLANDIERNRSFLRRKNRNGVSRYQETLDKALRLTSVLSGKPLGDDLINNFSQQLGTVTPPLKSPLEPQQVSRDNRLTFFNEFKESKSQTQHNNLQVAKKSLAYLRKTEKLLERPHWTPKLPEPNESKIDTSSAKIAAVSKSDMPADTYHGPGFITNLVSMLSFGAVGGYFGGIGLGPLIGAAIGATLTLPFGGVGAIPGAIVGSIIGSIAGAIGGALGGLGISHLVNYAIFKYQQYKQNKSVIQAPQNKNVVSPDVTATNVRGSTSHYLTSEFGTSTPSTGSSMEGSPTHYGRLLPPNKEPQGRLKETQEGSPKPKQ